MPRKKREREVPPGVRLDPSNGQPMITDIAPTRDSTCTTIMFMGEEEHCRKLVEEYFIPRGASPRRVETPVVQWFVDVRTSRAETVRRKMDDERRKGRLTRWEFGPDPYRELLHLPLLEKEKEKGSLN